VDGVAALHLTLLARPFGDDAPLLADPPALRARAREQGHLCLRGLLPAAPVRALRDAVAGICAEMGLAGPKDGGGLRARRGARLLPYASPEWIELQRRVALLPVFRALGAEPELRAALRALFAAEPLPGRGDVCRVFLPGAPEWTTPPHQDLFFLRRGGFAEPERIWSAWIPLGECPEPLGGIAVWPGSQRLGLLPHDEHDERGPSVTPPPEACWKGGALGCGDVVLMDCRTVHRALPNATADRVRLSADYRFAPGAPVRE
jgi:hypothetical protein